MKAKYLLTGKIVCASYYSKDLAVGQGEINVPKRVKRIAKFYEMFEDAQKGVWIMSEYASGGSLKEYVER